MSKSAELARRLREVILNGTWIANTNYQQELTDLRWEEATATFGSLNSVAALTQHVHYYIRGLKQVLAGGPLEIRDKYSFDFPPIESAAQWDGVWRAFLADAEAFAARVEQIPAEKLAQAFVDERYGTYERNIEAMIEHSYYHLGQIVLIKKLPRPA